MQMHMLDQGLPPGMQYRAHSQLAAQSLGIFSKTFECLPGAVKQHTVDHIGMQLYPAVEGMW
jgi:hypothetical protein